MDPWVYTHIYVIYLSTATVNHHRHGHFRWVTKTLQRHQHMSSLTISLWPCNRYPSVSNFNLPTGIPSKNTKCPTARSTGVRVIARSRPVANHCHTCGTGTSGGFHLTSCGWSQWGNGWKQKAQQLSGWWLGHPSERYERQLG